MDSEKNGSTYYTHICNKDLKETGEPTLVSVSRSTSSTTPVPFVKWAGGKTQILDHIETLLPSQYSRYFEPFLGGGAVFFWLWRTKRLTTGVASTSSSKILLSDLNDRLIQTYCVVRDHPQELISELDKLIPYRTEKDYYGFRKIWSSIKDPIESSALFIYFNKLCYNGLYRENKNREFNVPWGKRPNAQLYNKRNILSTSKSLQDCDLIVCDFEKILSRVTENSLVYLDPPYHFPESNGFTGYTAGGFDEKEQERLSEIIHNLTSLGVKVILSNSCTNRIIELYPEDMGYVIETISTRRLISCDPDTRQKANEVLITNYPISDRQQMKL
jgi:DNA adenine methylase